MFISILARLIGGVAKKKGKSLTFHRIPLFNDKHRFICNAGILGRNRESPSLLLKTDLNKLRCVWFADDKRRYKLKTIFY